MNTRKNKIKFLLWSYLFLVIFEGALRKWFLPFLSTPLLLVRDPIALLALYWAWPLLVKSVYWVRLQILIYIGLFGIILALYVGHGDWFTALYGLRIYWIQLPLIFVFPLVFTRSDVLRAMWATILISVPMVILITAQSSTPPSHILNVAPGGSGTSAFSGAAGKFRPSGIFSFTNSVTTFFTFSAACLLAVVYGSTSKVVIKNHNHNHKPLIKRLVVFLGILSLIVALPVSISRSLMANYGIVLITTLLILITTKTKILSLIYGLFLVYLISILTLNVPVVREAADAFALRWELAARSEASTAEGNTEVVADLFQGRILSKYTEPILKRDEYPLLGRGIGMGSNIGAVRLAGARGHLLSESSWGKQIDELGLFLGTVFIIWRISLSYYIIKASLSEAFYKQNSIAIILTAASLWGLLSGQLVQSSALGFIVGTTGLTLASFITKSEDT